MTKVMSGLKVGQEHSAQNLPSEWSVKNSENVIIGRHVTIKSEDNNVREHSH